MKNAQDVVVKDLDAGLRQLADRLKAKGERATEQAYASYLLKAAIDMAAQNVANNNGPFAAIVADLQVDHVSPIIIGAGANSVNSTFDPTAHAEVNAIRNTQQRLGYTDLKGLTLVTSCECCPMCLSLAVAARIDRIYFAASADDAARAGFSDADQYALMRTCTIALQASVADSTEATRRLGSHDAVVIVPQGDEKRAAFYCADEGEGPEGLAGAEAIRKACMALQLPHLPEGTQLLLRRMPHPFTLMAADNARIGRIRDPQAPLDPARDRKDADGLLKKDTQHFRHCAEGVEVMKVTDGEGRVSFMPSHRVMQEIALPASERAMKMQMLHGFKHIKAQPFEKWQKALTAGQVGFY